MQLVLRLEDNVARSLRMAIIICCFLLTYFLSIYAEEELPRNLQPKKYIVELKVDTQKRTLEGTVCIEVQCSLKSNLVKLHGKQKNNRLRLKDKREMTFLRNYTKNKQEWQEVITIKSTEYDYDNDILTLHTSDLVRGEKYTLCIPYTGVISEENDYIIWEHILFERFDGHIEKNYIVATNFERQSAFPCFDEPFFKAEYEIILQIKEDETSFGNVDSQRVKMENGWVLDTYIVKSLFAPSQICFAIIKIYDVDLFKFDYMFSTKWSVTFWARNLVRRNLKLSEKLVGRKVTNRLFNLGPIWALPRVQILIIQTNVEIKTYTWGLVLMRESDFVEATAEETEFKIFVRMTSHLFGGIVSPDEWESEWLYKALATYMAYLEMQSTPYIEKVPSLMWQNQHYDLESNMEHSIDYFQQITSNHQKGLMLLRMIHRALTLHILEQILDTFLTRYQFLPSDEKEFYRLLTIFSTDMLKNKVLPDLITWSDVMDSWNKIGYPVVTVEQLGKGKFRLSQEPIKGDLMSPKSPEGCWYFPYTYISTSKPNYRIKRTKRNRWMGCDNTSREIKLRVKRGQWIILNPNYIGLYRVKYDDASYKLIIDALLKDPTIVHHGVRAQLLNDAFTLAWLGHQTYESTFKLLTFMKLEVDDTVWRVFFAGATNIMKMLDTEYDLQKLQEFFKSFLEDAFNNKYRDRPFIFDSDKLKRVATKIDAVFYNWACNILDLKQCRVQALNLYIRWIEENYFPRDLSGCRKVVYTTMLCTVLQEIGRPGNVDHSDWRTFFLDHLLTMEYEKANYRHMLIDAIECVSDTETLNRIFEWVTTPAHEKTTEEEKVQGFLELTKGKFSYLPTLNFFYDKFPTIHTYYQSADVMAKLVYGLAIKMDQTQFKKMAAFIGGKPELNDQKISNSLVNAKSIVDKKVLWRITHAETIRSVLQ